MKPDLPPLLRTLCTVELNVDPRDDLPDEFWLRLPTEAGVVLLGDENGRHILIRGIGDPRAFVRRRLAPDPDDLPGRTDYRAVTRSLSIIPTGHTLLAELMSARCEEYADPRVAEASAARLNAAFVLCDPSARLPMFREVGWKDLWTGADTPTPHERILGPFSSPRRAKRWIERIVDLFDLCRYDHLLAQTPNATACVYKQMGKCPAPCDGSEPIESYRERFSRAAAFVGKASEFEAGRCRREMETAAADLDFEKAGALKERLDMIESLDSGGPWEVCDLGETIWRCCGPASRKGWLRRWQLSPDGLAMLADSRDDENLSPEQIRPDRAARLLSGRIVWLLIATMIHVLGRGLTSAEEVRQTVRESHEINEKKAMRPGVA